MFGYHYYAGADGRCYCYAKEATVRCPFNPSDPERAAEILARLEKEPLIFGFDAMLLLRRAHRAGSHVVSDDGVTCTSCGARVERLGYGAWIEEPWPSEEELVAEARERARETGEEEALAVQSARSTWNINQRLGSTHRRKPGSFRYFPLKRESMTWAREEAALDLSIAREEAAVS